MRKFILDFERPLAELEEKLDELKKLSSAGQPDIAAEIQFIEAQLERLRIHIYTNLTPWQRVQIARHPDRPRTADYIEAMFTDFIELKGDRLFSDDPAVIGGLARLEHLRVVIVGTQKGRNTKENIARNFGMPHPEGYRKALRLYDLAKKYNLPVITFIDTLGAYPGIGAEERGQAVAIARNLVEMSALPVPIVAVNIGEGGSGGALAIGVSDWTIMLENSYYSVITPEGCASILWRDDGQAPAAADALGLTSDVLLEHKLIDTVVKEPLGGAHKAPALVARDLKKVLMASLRRFLTQTSEELVENRYARLRAVGSFDSTEAPKSAEERAE
ncbi:MAG: acetyl-CoA carboxylase carboxyltransferase subunit alpha [Candidatus Aquicultorales bacterium]